MKILITDNQLNDEAARLSEKLNAPIVTIEEPGEVYLFVSEKGLSLKSNGQEIYGDFSRLTKRLNKSNLLGETIVRAVKIKGSDSVTVIDATAGLGEDSFLLAAAGNRVILFERDPVIAELLDDALRRASLDDKLSAIVERMTLIKGDSIREMKAYQGKADVVLLDPMFPEREKSSLVKKKFQLIHCLEEPCSDEQELLEAAKAVQPEKIVIKRPQKGPYLAGEKPNHSFDGKSIRYDVIIPQKKI